MGSYWRKSESWVLTSIPKSQFYPVYEVTMRKLHVPICIVNCSFYFLFLFYLFLCGTHPFILFITRMNTGYWQIIRYWINDQPSKNKKELIKLEIGKEVLSANIAFYKVGFPSVKKTSFVICFLFLFCPHGCLHVCPHGCLHVCAHECLYVCPHGCLHVFPHGCLHVCMCTTFT